MSSHGLGRMKNIFRLLSYIKNYKQKVGLNVLFNVLYVFFNLFSVVMVVPFVSVLFGLTDSPEKCPEFALTKDAVIGYVSYWLTYYRDTAGFFTCLIYICTGFVLFTLLGNFCRYMGFYFLAPVRNGVLRDIRNDIYKKITVLPVSFFSDRQRGDIIARITSDVSVVEWTVFSCLQMVIKDPVMIIIYSCALFLADWKFTLFAVVVIPLPLILIRKIGESLSRNSIKGQKKMGELVSLAEEAVSMGKVTKSLNAEGIMTDRFAKRNNSYAKTISKVIARTELASPLTEFCMILILAAVVLKGGTLVLKGSMNPAVLIGFTVIFSRIISPVKELITAYYNFEKGEAAAQRINQILDSEEKIEEKKDAVMNPGFGNEIRFDKVCFSYEGNDNFRIEDVSFVIKKGQKVAIVGASGSGKSTLFDLFLRFADPLSGTVSMDGTDIRNFNINSLRSCFGIVTQQSILFNDTVKNNISFGLTDVSDEQIIRAAKTANADEFIVNLPYGYNTNTGDGASLLSGGQRQRLCIARAVLRNPDILLLDEATSAMDSANEYKVTQAINSLAEDRTVIVIAHRLSTVTDSDLIIVMHQGSVVQTGTHDSLMKESGYYKKLVELQKL